jgi:hypothetical protein
MNALLRGWDKGIAAWSIFGARMRARMLAVRGARVGAKAALGRRCVVDRPWCVELGERVLLEPDVYLKIVADAAKLTLGAYTFVGSSAAAWNSTSWAPSRWAAIR